MVPLVPVLLLNSSASVSPRLLVPAFAWLLLAALFSATATHDYLASHRAVWSLAREHQRRAPDALIDAGFEYNNYEQQHAELFDGAAPLNALAERPSAPFAIAYSAPDGARVLARASTHAWLPFAPREVVLFARNP